MKNTERFFLILIALSLISCAAQPYNDTYSAPGFFMGIIHGLIAPFTLIGSIFMDIRIYAFPNSGVWYDFGFMFGLSSYVSMPTITVRLSNK